MDFTNPQIMQQGNNYHVVHGDDRGLFVRFRTDAVEDAEASLEAGRPIFKDRDFIIINIVGDKLTEHVRPVDLVGNGNTPPDNVRFPRQWEAFKAQKEQPHDGTPITEWAPVSKSLAMELKSMNIHTVEALAAVADHNLNWLGARELRAKAQAWLESAKTGAVPAQILEENAKLKRDIDALKQQIAAIAADKPRRGRPAKEVNDAEDAD